MGLRKLRQKCVGSLLFSLADVRRTEPNIIAKQEPNEESHQSVLMEISRWLVSINRRETLEPDTKSDVAAVEKPDEESDKKPDETSKWFTHEISHEKPDIVAQQKPNKKSNESLCSATCVADQNFDQMLESNLIANNHESNQESECVKLLHVVVQTFLVSY